MNPLPNTHVQPFRADRFHRLLEVVAALDDEQLDIAITARQKFGTQPGEPITLMNLEAGCILAWYAVMNPAAGVFWHRGWLCTRGETGPATGTLFWGANAFAAHFGVTYSEAVNVTSPYCYPLTKYPTQVPAAKLRPLPVYDHSKPRVLERLRALETKYTNPTT